MRLPVLAVASFVVIAAIAGLVLGGVLRSEPAPRAKPHPTTVAAAGVRLELPSGWARGGATTLAGFHSPFFLDDINYSYTPDDYTPMKTLYISQFNGKDWDISDKPVTE